MSEARTVQLDPLVSRYIAQRKAEFDQISQTRRDELQPIADYTRRRLDEGKPARLTFICTHNSRRSHLSQIWARIAADVYGLQGIETYSGGTEATAFNPRAVATLKRSGMRITTDDASVDNPVYCVQYSDDSPPQVCFSKVFDQPPNPVKEYCAIMTCSQADEACPVVIGCDLRAPVRYEDPKIADGTPEESMAYDERSRQICREMLFLMSLVGTVPPRC